MPTIRRVNNTKRQTNYQAVIRKRGFTLSRVFRSADGARKWATKVEAAIDQDCPATPFRREDWFETTAQRTLAASEQFGDTGMTPNRHWTVARALKLYGETVSPTKASPDQEASRIKVLTASLGHIALGALSSADVQRHVRAREKARKAASTVRLEVMQLRALWRHARSPVDEDHPELGGWGLDLGPMHPCDNIKLSPSSPGRNRRLQDADPDGEQQAEEEALRAALTKVAKSPEQAAELVDIFDLMLATAMRRGEVLTLHRAEVRREGRLLVITKAQHKTKRHGANRRIVLSTTAAAIVRRRLSATDPTDPTDRLWSITANQLAHRWRKARKQAGCKDVRMHDLRHEGISRMADKGLTVGELQEQSGHSSAQMLMRYVNARATDIAAKLG